MTNIDPQFRLSAYREAHKCLRMVDRLDISEPEFWANLFGAIVNTNIACIPDSVAAALVSQDARRAALRDHLDGTKGLE